MPSKGPINTLVPKRPDPPLVYWEYLQNHPNFIAGSEYTSQTLIENDTRGGAPNTEVAYDATFNTAKFTLPANQQSATGSEVVEPHIGQEINSGKLMVTWDVRWETDWRAEMVDTMARHKMFRLDRDGTGETRMYEIRLNYTTSAPQPGRPDLRLYEWNSDDPIDAKFPTPDNTFTCEPDVWTRIWIHIDWAGSTTLWFADETQSPVKVYDALGLSNMVDEIEYLSFGYNSSQTRSGGAAVDSWFRNVAFLHNYSDPQTIVDQGASVV